MALKIKNTGYAWAALTTPAMILMLMYNENLSRALISAFGLRISPRFSGGEIVRTADHGRYRTNIHRPVFNGLTGDRKTGFIQVDWEPVTSLPETIREELDIYGNAEKFIVILNSADGTVSYENKPFYVAEDPIVSHFHSGWAVRIGLKKGGRNKEEREGDQGGLAGAAQRNPSLQSQKPGESRKR